MSRSSTPGGGSPQPWGFGDEKERGSERPTERPGFSLPHHRMPPESPPRQRRDRSRRRVWFVLLVVVVLLALVGGGVVAYASMRAGAAVQAAQRYCAALLADNYAAAYDTLSPSLQAQSPRDQFVADGKLHDQVDGRVTSCAVSDGASGPLGSVSQISSTTLTLDTTLRRSLTYTGAVTMAQQGSNWKIASISSPLQGSNLAPLKTAQAFCAALLAGNYSTAYSLLSSGQQSQVSEQQFAGQFSDTFAGSSIHLAGCELDLATYAAGSTTAHVTALLTVQNTQASSGLLKVALTMVREGGAWKIDDMHLTN